METTSVNANPAHQLKVLHMRSAPRVCTTVLYSFKLHVNYLHTTDVDECAGNSTCDGNADCIDSDGSYWCQCLPGFTGDGYNCTGQSLANYLGFS